MEVGGPGSPGHPARHPVKGEHGPEADSVTTQALQMVAEPVL